MSLIAIIFTDDIKPTDILLGKGTKFKNHVGSIAFKALVEANVATYDAPGAESCDKTFLTVEVLERILGDGGRFLKHRDGDVWAVFDKETAREKVRDAFRDSVKGTRKSRPHALLTKIGFSVKVHKDDRFKEIVEKVEQDPGMKNVLFSVHATEKRTRKRSTSKHFSSKKKRRCQTDPLQQCSIVNLPLAESLQLPVFEPSAHITPVAPLGMMIFPAHTDSQVMSQCGKTVITLAPPPEPSSSTCQQRQELHDHKHNHYVSQQSLTKVMQQRHEEIALFDPWLTGGFEDNGTESFDLLAHLKRADKLLEDNFHSYDNHGHDLPNHESNTSEDVSSGDESTEDWLNEFIQLGRENTEGSVESRLVALV